MDFYSEYDMHCTRVCSVYTYVLYGYNIVMVHVCIHWYLMFIV